MFSGTLLYFPYPNSFDQLKIYNLKGSELNFEKKEEVGMDFYHQTITRQKMKAKHLIAMPSAVSRLEPRLLRAVLSHLVQLQNLLFALPTGS